MPAKTLLLDCSPALQQILCDAIRLYAAAAYPPGGSECAQVAREALLDAAQSIETQFNESGQAEVSRRLRSQFKAALEYFAETADEQALQQQALQLQDILKGNSHKTG